MPNTNLIVPNEVTGNISSCQTELSIIHCAERDSLFTCTDIGYATNNCTGETIVHESWSMTGVGGLSISILSILALAIIFTSAAIIHDKIIY